MFPLALREGEWFLGVEGAYLRGGALTISGGDITSGRDFIEENRLYGNPLTRGADREEKAYLFS